MSGWASRLPDAAAVRSAVVGDDLEARASTPVSSLFAREDARGLAPACLLMRPSMRPLEPRNLSGADPGPSRETCVLLARREIHPSTTCGGGGSQSAATVASDEFEGTMLMTSRISMSAYLIRSAGGGA